MEIERKYLLNRDDIPVDLSSLRSNRIRQGYLNPDGMYIIRVRGIKQFQSIYSSPEYFVLCIKSSGLLIRDEWEVTISERKFEDMLQKCNRKIDKVRYYMEEKALTYEIDDYVGRDLMTIEVEFDSEKDANKFIPPDWFGLCVTFDENYKNVNLAQ